MNYAIIKIAMKRWYWNGSKFCFFRKDAKIYRSYQRVVAVKHQIMRADKSGNPILIMEVK